MEQFPVRWGDLNQPRTVKVYSSCSQAELFLNGISVGRRRRDSHDFPAAGLRWDVPFRRGKNDLRVIATTVTGDKVTDELSFLYQTDSWGLPAKLALRVIDASVSRTTVEATLLDAHGVLCLDARNVVRFSVAGEGKLIDNGGTSSTSRVVQLQNGRSIIGVVLVKGSATVGVTAEGMTSSFCSLPPAQNQLS